MLSTDREILNIKLDEFIVSLKTLLINILYESYGRLTYQFGLVNRY